MRLLSPVFLEAMHAQESGQVLVPIIELRHPSWEAPLRLVRDSRPLVHAGQTFIAYPFDIALPDDDDEGRAVLRWTAENVSRDLVSHLRVVTDKIEATIAWVLTSQPDTVEAGPFDVEITGVTYDARTITGEMTVEPVLEEAFSRLRMTPRTTPAVF